MATLGEVLALVETLAPEGLKLLDEALHLLMAERATEAQAVTAARDAADVAVDALEASKDKP